jgi:hypothetical protein
VDGGEEAEEEDGVEDSCGETGLAFVSVRFAVVVQFVMVVWLIDFGGGARGTSNKARLPAQG